MAAKVCSADNFRCFEVKPLLTIREYVNLELFDAREGFACNLCNLCLIC